MADDEEVDKILKAMTEETEYTNSLGAYTTDEQGKRVLVGLTLEETEELHGLKRELTRRRFQAKDPFPSADELKAARARFKELHTKHEAVRLQIVGAEAALRNKPTIN